MDKITIERQTLDALLDEWAVAAGQTWYHAGASRGIETGRCVSREDLRQLVRAALAAQPAPAAVPPGYALVPIEPTHGMLSALTQEWHPSKHGPMKQRYRAMIAAARDKP